MTYNLQGKCILIHGPPKIGKTQLASSFPACQFIATESGHNYLPEVQRQIKIDISDGNDFKSIKIHPKAKTVVLDTVDGAYRKAKAAGCAKFKCFHPSDKGDYGRTVWNYINDLFYTGFGELVSMCGQREVTLILTAHTVAEELEIGALTVTKMSIGLAGQAKQAVTPVPDHFWYLGYGNPEDTELTQSKEKARDLLKNWRDTRMLVIKGGELIEAGTRDESIVTSVICPLNKPDRKNKTGGYWQIIEELKTDQDK